MSIENLQKDIRELKEILLDSKGVPKEIFTLPEAAKYMSISKSYLYKLTSNNKITYSKPEGKVIYFKKSDLNQWMLRSQVKSNDELEEEIYRNTFSKR